jgi:hypothetical protein
MKLFLFVALLFSFFLLPFSVFAHSGGGPPFLKINDKYAQTNPYSGTLTLLHIPQDIPPEQYLVNKSITLSLDTDQLNKQTFISADLIDGLVFRWSLWEGDNFDKRVGEYKDGTEVSYAIKTPKSYLIKLEAKSPLDEDFIVLDTVQINILPNMSYHMPTASVFIGTQKNNESLFVSQSKVNSKSTIKTYLWEVGGKLQNGPSIKYTFNQLTPYDTRTVFHRVVDSNGFSTDIGFVGEMTKGQVAFVPYGTMKKVAITQGTYSQAEKLANGSENNASGKWGIALWLVGQLITLSVLALLFAKYRKIQKKK